MWDYKRYVNVAKLTRDAHQNGTDTSSLSFSYDGLSIATRGGDDTVKLWDIRKMKEPVAVAKDLFNRFPMFVLSFIDIGPLLILFLKFIFKKIRLVMLHVSCTE